MATSSHINLLVKDGGRNEAAVADDDHFARCMTFIDLNMVRAGVVDDPVDWPESGYADHFTPENPILRQKLGPKSEKFHF